MDDRTMLELAAKSIGKYALSDGYIYAGFGSREWNPLADDGDALRLMIAVGVGFIIDDEFVNVFRCGHELLVDLCEYYANHGGDKTAATRRAITRAAAEIQLAKESGK